MSRLYLALAGPCFVSAAALAAPARAADGDVHRPVLAADHPAMCSSRFAVCVHSAADHARYLPGALRDLEAAALSVREVLRWPHPLSDGSLGGSGAFDLYLQHVGNAPYLVGSDASWESFPFDRASAFAIAPPMPSEGCFQAAIFAEVYARAGLMSVDAAANEPLATATAAYVASQAVPCSVAILDAIDDYQAAPHLAISHRDARNARGAMLFPLYLQQTLGVGASVDLLHALYSLSSQSSKDAADRWVDEPDVFDTLSRLQMPRHETLPDLLLDYAVARAFVGERDDGLHLPDTRSMGAFGRVRFDWSVLYASLPRSLTPAFPIEPTGASYIWLELGQRSKTASVIIEATWEEPVVFRFAVVQVSSSGTAISRTNPISPERGTHLQLKVDPLEDAAALVVVATNVGSLRPEERFDPDSELTLARNLVVTLYPDGER